MPRSVRTLALVLLAVVALVSCDDDGAITPPPGGSLPLPEGYWYLNTANDSALPATVSERTVGVALEETVVDSGFILVGDDGSWSQRYWYRVFVTGVLDRTEVVIDQGTWAEAPLGSPANTYILTSSVRDREIEVTFQPPATELFSTEHMVFYQNAPTVAGTYRRTRP